MNLSMQAVKLPLTGNSQKPRPLSIIPRLNSWLVRLFCPNNIPVSMHKQEPIWALRAQVNTRDK